LCYKVANPGLKNTLDTKEIPKKELDNDREGGGLAAKAESLVIRLPKHIFLHTQNLRKQRQYTWTDSRLIPAKKECKRVKVLAVMGKETRKIVK